jgi:hypothetical protein
MSNDAAARDCVASKKIIRGDRKVGFMFRETPEKHQPPGARGDSGWRFFAGDESDAFINLAENFNIYPVKAVIDLDPAISAHLNAPVGSAFKRQGDTETFVKVPFPDPKNPTWRE